MHDTGVKLLRLMFRPDETICISNGQYGYHSMALQNAIDGPVVLVPPIHTVQKMGFENTEDAITRISSDEIILCALNPIKGFREDMNCIAFRNFLVEMDDGSSEEQLAYVNKLKMPFSAAVFSGNKSLHFLISLDRDLPSENVYRVFSEWILNVVTLADPNTKNPSRSIRVPGAYREPGKQQLLKEFRGAVKLEDLVAWLNQYPDAKPKPYVKKERLDSPNKFNIRPSTFEKLVNGIRPPERNKQWFTIACEFCLSGYNEDDTIDMLGEFFTPERDFKQREWTTAIRSAFKYVEKKKS